MKIRSIIFATLLITSASGVCAQNRPSEAAQDGLTGNVQKVTSTMYEAYVDRDGEMQYGDQMERTETQYNEKGQRRNMTFLSVAEDNVMFRSRYKHDGFGLMTLEHIIDNNEQIIGRTYYIYDQNLTLTESYVEDQERQIEHRVLYTYDNDGRIKQRSYNDAKNQVYKREVYVYDLDGGVYRTAVYDRTNFKMREYHYEYDTHHQPINITVYDYTDEDPDVTTHLYQYKYDAQGNWIQKTEYYLEKGKANPTYITNRKIEYFQ